MMEPAVSARRFNARAGTLSCPGSIHSYIISEDYLEDEVRYNSVSNKYWGLVPISQYSDFIVMGYNLGFGVFQSSPGDSNILQSLEINDVRTLA